METGSETVRETVGITLRAIMRYVREQGGDDAVDRVLELAGAEEPVAAYLDARRWWPYETKISMFRAAANVLRDETVGLRVGRSVLPSLGWPLRFGLRLLGGPGQVIKLITARTASVNMAADMTALHVGKHTATLQYRLRAGYRPSRYDCDYTRGLLVALPTLYGAPPAMVAHDMCQVLGADACVYTMRWQRRRLPGFGARSDGGSGSSKDPLAGHGELLQRTIAELAAAHHPERVLGIIAERAGYAVHAQAMLLVARDGERPAQVGGYGLPPEEVDRLIAEHTTPVTGPGALVTDIASGTQYHGYLLAYCDDFADHDRQLLQTYAHLAAMTLEALRARDASAERQRVAENLLGLTRSLARAQTPDEVARVTAQAAHAVMRADSAAVLLLDGDRLRISAHAGFAPEHLNQLRSFAITANDTSLFDRFLANPHRSRIHGEDSADPFVRTALNTFGLHNAAVVGIALPDHPYGLLVAGFDGPHGIVRSRDFAVRMSGIADQAATVLRNCELVDHTWQLVHADPLTGLANRKAFMAALDTALSIGDGAVLITDLQGFKEINESLGHGAGDALLSAVAGRLAGCTRTGDVVARVGGDEFIVLTHGALGIAGVQELATRIRQAFAAPVALRDTLAVDVRAWVAGTRFSAGELAENIMHRANAAMARAKQSGGGEV